MEMASLSADRVLLLGPLQVIQNGASLPLPPSRKVRALLAYLVTALRPVTREKLCELFGCGRRPQRRVALVSFQATTIGRRADDDQAHC